MQASEEDVENLLDDIESQLNVDDDDIPRNHPERAAKVADIDDENDDDTPPGYLSYDEWIAAGKDPDNYRGKKAYSAEYERIQEIKENKEALRRLESTLNKVVDSAKKRDIEQATKHKAELEALKARQIEENDTAGALKTQEQITAVDQEIIEKVHTESVESSPFYRVQNEFFAKHAILDQSSDQFNQEFFNDMAAFVNTKIEQAGKGLNEALHRKILANGYAEAKSLNPNLFKSARNTRQRGANDKPRGRTPPREQSLKDIELDARNPANRNAADDFYQELLAQGHKDEAEEFRKRVNLLVEQQ